MTPVWVIWFARDNWAFSHTQIFERGGRVRGRNTYRTSELAEQVLVLWEFAVHAL